MINLIVIVLIFVLAGLIINRFSYHINKVIERSRNSTDDVKSKQIITTMTIVRSVIRYLVYFLAVILALNQIGFGTAVNNLLITAGIGGLIISTGAQSIVSDMLAGLFLVFERQFSVGDYVKIGDYEGTITAVTMRVTHIRDITGRSIIIPNGQIKSVIRYETDYILSSIEVPVPYEYPNEMIHSILTRAAESYWEKHPENFREKPEVKGISSYGSNCVNILITAKATPSKHYQVERDLRSLIKEELEKEGIAIAHGKPVINTKDYVTADGKTGD